MVPQPRWLRALALAAATIVLSSLAVALPTAAQADTAPTAPTPGTVSSDALPTVQVDGVVWAQVIVGNTVYVGGQFTQAQPAGAAAGVNETTRTNLLAYDLTTGALITSWAPSANAQVRGLAASPDGKTIYAAGYFTQVNGTTASHVVALDAATGAVNTKLASTIRTNAAAFAVVATSSTVYFVGGFTTVNTVARTRAAAVSSTTGAVTGWAPNLPDGVARAIVISPDASQLVLGGSFSSLNGSSSPGEGLGAVDATTGASTQWDVGKTIYEHGSNASIESLWSDGTNVYGSGYVYGALSDGNLEGTFSAKWAGGTLNWIEDCHGDTYGVAAMDGAVYTVSHAHYCGNVPDGFQQTDPDPSKATHQRALAFSVAPAGTLLHDTYGGSYADFGGQPSPDLLTWYPDLTEGSFTGQNQAAWSVAAGNGYVVLGGEFPTVNGTRQTGLVRFATSAIAPDKDGPRVAGATWPATAVSLATGTARVSWQANYDRDNANLTYAVTRSGTTAPVYTTTAVSHDWWLRPQLGFVDSGLTPGASYTYQVTATDPFGNSAKSSSVTVTAAAATASSPYANQVAADGASDYWRLGEAGGSTAYDWAGFNDLTVGSGVTRGTAGAIVGDSDTASTFSGASDASGLAATATAVPGPSTFSVEAWFNTTSTTGGKIVGFGDKNTGTSNNYDRHVYMDAAGHVLFGVYPGFTATVQSSKTYNDGVWHSVVATLGSGGMALFVDGKQVSARTDVTTAQAYSGYWRVGGDTSWSGANFFAGAIDDVAIYPSALTASVVKNHYRLSGEGPAAAAPADAYGQAVYQDAPDLYWRLGDASGAQSVTDASGNGDAGVPQNGVTFGAAGGVRGTTDTAATFDGSSGIVVASQPVTDPEVYTEELWFKTTTTSGGKLIGLGDAQSGTSSNYDRHIFMTDSGQLTFGVWTGQIETVTSANSYNDGAWHQVVATQGGDGLTLYVDGQSVGTNPTSQAQSYTGYWRIGGDNTWNSSSAFFNGTLDEVAVYSSELPAAEIARHYSLGAAAVNQAPTAAFTATVTGLKADFDASGSTDSDGHVTSYAWDFGDGTTGSGVAPTHTFAAGGSYQVVLTVTDDGGATGTLTKTLTVTAPNQPPTAAFTASPNGLTATFDATASADPDGTVASYAWDFGDGSTGTGVTTSHRYASAGAHTATLTVTDAAGATDAVSHSFTLVAPNTPPTASFTTKATDQTVAFDGTASADSDGTIASYAWDFGDGSTAGTGATTSHSYATPGTYTVVLTVTDDQGATATATHAVTATAPKVNLPPTAAFTSSATNLNAAFDGSASTDSDGTVKSYAWDFGDGATGSGATTTHTYAAAGTFTVALTVTDDQGATNTVTHTVSVTKANVEPTAAFTSTAAGLTASFDASGSTDSDGTVASYAWTFGDGATGTGRTPTHAYATAGTDTVTLTVTDDKGATNQVSHTVTVTAPATSTTLAKDAFGRSVAAGLGTADTGGAWTSTAGSAGISANGSRAVLATGVGKTLAAQLSAVSSSSTDVQASYGFSALPTGSSVYASLVGRQVGTGFYSARLVVATSGAVSVQLLNGATTLQTKATGLTYGTADRLQVRLQVTGTSPTTVQAKVWKVGGTEPAAWTATTTDSTAAMQAKGAVGIGSYLSSSATNGPISVTVDDLLATSIGAATPPPANVAPTAAFTSAVSGLTVSFDGSGSTDSDGKVASYAWDFGDGATSTSSTPSHTYAAAGTDTVTLTVTDDQGAKGTITHAVTVTAPVTSTALAKDAFGRTVVSGLGTADVGGAWTTSGSAANYAVGSGTATLKTASGGTLSAYLGSVASTSTDISASLTVPALPVGGSLYLGVVGRRIGTDDYNARVLVSATGAVTLQVLHGATSLKSATVPGITAAAGTVLHLRLRTTGSGTTTLQARVWADGTAEPTTWQAVGTDTTAALQAAGSVGIRTYLSSGATNGPATVKVDDFEADPVQ